MNDSYLKYVGELYLSSREKVETILAEAKKREEALRIEITQLKNERDALLAQMCKE